jgi:CRISPR-associated endonuclease/helicase Cas3
VDRLLQWLGQLGCTVVLLSATLPATRRRELVEAYAGVDVAQQAPDVPYPRVTWATQRRADAIPVAVEREVSRKIRLEWIAPGTERLVSCLTEALEEGGCAAVICNTVGRAQETFGALRDAGLGQHVELDLLHARFPFGQRQRKERRALGAFGKGGHRPHRAILVATQVIEQSLDVDFDLMVTELGPVDLMLQRAGRLHRHARRSRPERLQVPQLWMIEPGADDRGVPDFGPSEYVYERYVLLRSLLALRDRHAIRVPDEVEPLIECVYGAHEPDSHGLPEGWPRALQESHAKAQRHREDDADVARSVLVDEPRSADDLLESFNAQLGEDDDPALHKSLRAATRLGRPSVSLVCLHKSGGRLSLDPEGHAPVDLGAPPDPDTTKALLNASVALTYWAVVKHFVHELVPPGWRQNAALRFHRAACFEGRRLPIGRQELVWDEELGLHVRSDHEGGEPFD